MIVTSNPEIFVHTSSAPEPMIVESASVDKNKQSLVKITIGKPQRLDSTYTPGEWDVICARGKYAWNHTGNKHFRFLIKQYQNDFGTAKTRLERMTVVTNVVDAVRSKGMGFVKKDEKDGHYWQIGDRLSREKVGTLLRDAQGSRYSSSSQAKKRRRKDTTTVISQSTQQVVLSNAYVAETLTNLTQDLASASSSSTPLTDDQLVNMFTQASCQMLEAIKQDNSLLPRFNDAMCIDKEDDDTASLNPDECNSMAME